MARASRLPIQAPSNQESRRHAFPVSGLARSTASTRILEAYALSILVGARTSGVAPAKQQNHVESPSILYAAPSESISPDLITPHRPQQSGVRA